MLIMTDSPSLYSPKEGKELGLTVIPACTVVDGVPLRDYEDIETESFLKKLEGGSIPTSSQPAIGDIIEAYENNSEEILVLPIGDGLSGTYQNMQSAKNFIEDSERIHIMDTKTLAGPQRYLVNKAMALRNIGASIEEIKNKLLESIESSHSFVIPSDFNFLKRSGRLTPFAAKLGTIMKIVPVMTQTEDKKKITRFCIKNSQKSALDAIVRHLKELCIGKGYLITVCHGGAEEAARNALSTLRESIEGALFELHLLSPALVCHGGPGCILIQAVKL